MMILLLLHTAATLAMTGVIWFVQIVHYPLFDRVGATGFAYYEDAHSRLTTFVVAPLMLVEAAAAVSLAVLIPNSQLVWWGLALLALVWLSTFFVQVPQHRRLAGGFNMDAHRRLVQTNWVRTIAWSARGALALALLPGVLDN